jgi:phosphomannomutase
VIDIAPGVKVSSTPLMYFATWLFNTDGGVEVTGSHLDKEWNGINRCWFGILKVLRCKATGGGFMRDQTSITKKFII